MSVTCTANALALAAGCFEGVSSDLQQAIRIRLLCGYINGETMTCDVNTLAGQSTCYLGLSASQMEAVQTYLVCQLAAAGGGGSGGAFVGTGSPQGVQTGSPPNTYMDITDPANPIYWVKTSGTGTNTGWIQLV